MKKLTYEVIGGIEVISFQNFAATTGIENNNTSAFAKDKDPGLHHLQLNDKPGGMLYFVRHTAEGLQRVYAEVEAMGLKAPKGGVSDGYGRFRVDEPTDPRWTAAVQERLGRHMWTDEDWKKRETRRIVRGKKKPHTKFLLLPAKWPRANTSLYAPVTKKTLDLDKVSVKLFRAGLLNQLAGLREGARINRSVIIQAYARMTELLS